MPDLADENQEELDTEEQLENAEQPDEQAEQDAFEASFDDDSEAGYVSDEADEQLDAAEQTEDETQEAGAEQPSTPDPIQEKLDRLEKMESRLRNVEGRYGELNGRLQNLSSADAMAAHAASEQQAGTQGFEAPSKEQFRDALKSGEKLKELVNDFPEWGEMQSEFIDLLSDRVARPEDIEAVRQESTQTARSEMAKLRQMVRLDMSHPDWEQTVQTPAFAEWITTQDEGLQQKFQSDSATDAITVLDAYQQHLNPPKQQQSNSSNQRRLESALAPETTGAATHSARTEEQEFQEAFNAG